MSAHSWCDRQLFGFDLFEWMMLLLAIAVLGAFAPPVDTLPPNSNFVDNTYDDHCANILARSASCTKFPLKDSLSPRTRGPVNQRR
jgi:hypothetical protein